MSMVGVEGFGVQKWVAIFEEAECKALFVGWGGKAGFQRVLYEKDPNFLGLLGVTGV